MKRVYTFGDGKAEGNASMRNLLGGKGANLAEMNLLGMPVPPGFTITTEVCTRMQLPMLKNLQARNSTIPKIPFSYLCARVHAHQCPV